MITLIENEGRSDERRVTITDDDEAEYDDRIIAARERALHKEIALDTERTADQVDEDMLDLDARSKLDLLDYVWEAIKASRDPLLVTLLHNGIKHVTDWEELAP